MAGIETWPKRERHYNEPFTMYMVVRIHAGKDSYIYKKYSGAIKVCEGARTHIFEYSSINFNSHLPITIDITSNQNDRPLIMK